MDGEGRCITRRRPVQARMTRPHSRACLVAAVVTVALLAAVPTLLLTTSGRIGSPTTQRSTAPGGDVTVAPAYVPGPGIRLVGQLPGSATLDVAVGLAPTDTSAIAAQLALEYGSGSPRRGDFLSAPQVADRFAPSAATYESAVRYFESTGATVTTSPDRWMLLVEASASTMARAFHTE